MSFFQFKDPWLLLLLFLIPALAFSRKSRELAVIQYSSIANLKALRNPRVNLMILVPPLLRYTAIALLIIALARPQEGHKRTEIVSTGVDIVLALDTSASMQALDFIKDNKRIDRLEVVKDVVSEFITKREHDRIGMVVFGDEAFTQCPLTLDHNILQSFLDKLKIGIAGDSTAIGSAIGIAVKRLKDLKAKSKVIILLTDGRNNAGQLLPIQAAEVAKAFHIKIYTVGVGTRGKAPFLVDSMFGKQYVYQNVEIDEKSLQTIAEMTGAKYFRATDLETLENIYEQIDQLEKSEVKTIDHSEYKELFPYFLVPGMLLFLTEVLLTNTRLRRIP
jgi:Ca-activated chloride channel family protein